MPQITPIWGICIYSAYPTKKILAHNRTNRTFAVPLITRRVFPDSISCFK